MKWWQELYGEDADGNRGQMMWMYEVEPEDDEIIIPFLQDIVEEDGYLPKTVEVRFINPYTEDDIDVEIDTADYKYLEPKFEVWEGDTFIEGGLLLEEAEEEYDESFDIKYNREL